MAFVAVQLGERACRSRCWSWAHTFGPDSVDLAEALGIERDVVHINDNKELFDDQREALLTKRFADAGYELEFVD